MTKRQRGLPQRWDMEADVVVLGSGGAALSAAVTAAEHGSSAAVLERTDKFGGTTAMSGAVTWIPNNHHMASLGVSDSREDALTYLGRLTAGKVAREMVETFVDTGPKMVRFLEAVTPVRYEALMYPDYHPEFAGARLGGRSLDPLLLDLKQLGELAEHVRLSPHNPMGVTIKEVEEGLEKLDYAAIAQRMVDNIRGGGSALIGGLLKTCAGRGVRLERGVRGRQLLHDGEAVVGVRAERDGRDVFVRAAQGVVLATGGFEWNDRLASEFLRGPVAACCSPPWNEGDNVVMAMEVGADLANMNEAWWHVLIHIPGEEYDKRPFYRVCLRERAKPGSILVNRQGRRFVNEAHNYNDVARALHTFDPVDFSYSNLPAWLIFDHRFKTRYFFSTVQPTDPAPRWFKSGSSVRELAAQIDVAPDGLKETVERFNSHARQGEDPDFHRGESLYDRFYGDKNIHPNPTLAPLETPPFYAVEVLPGASGTKGGPRTNAKAQVLDARGKVIPGLYAAGNAMASVMGPAYPGAGGTIGPALTFGYIAGRTAAQESRQ